MTEPLNSVGGGSNTPLKVTLSEKSKSIDILVNALDYFPVVNQPVRILYDWCSFTFDDIGYVMAIDNRTGTYKPLEFDYSQRTNEILSDLFLILGVEQRWQSYKKENTSINGYCFMYLIGENIKLLFGGPESKNGRPTSMLLMSGQACREFDNYFRKGSNTRYYELFKFLFTLNGHFTRLDTAFDVFDKEILNIYKLEKYAVRRWWRGRFRTFTIFNQIDFKDYDDIEYIENDFDNTEMNETFSAGYSLNWGLHGANQVVIYDKNLERRANAKDKTSYDDEIISDVWYRVEMRLVDDKADELARQYILAFEKDPEGFSFSKYATGVLNGLLCFIEPKWDSKGKLIHRRKQHRSKWDMMPMWQNFIGHSERTILLITSKEERTVNHKMEWANRSLHSFFAMIALAHGGFDKYLIYQIDLIKKGLKDLTDKQLESVNKHLKNLGLNPLEQEDLREFNEFLNSRKNHFLATSRLDDIFDEIQASNGKHI